MPSRPYNDAMARPQSSYAKAAAANRGVHLDEVSFLTAWQRIKRANDRHAGDFFLAQAALANDAAAIAMLRTRLTNCLLPRAPKVNEVMKLAVESLLERGLPAYSAQEPLDGLLRATVRTSDAICSIRRRDVARVKALLDAGFDPKERNQGDREWALHLATLFSVPLVKLFLEQGANASELDQFGRTMLFDTPFTAVAEELLARGVDPNVCAKEPAGVTALMAAAEQGRLGVVRMLLNAGADVHASSARGGTALEFATEQGHAKVIAALLDAGAKPSKRVLALAAKHPRLKHHQALFAPRTTLSKHPK